MYCVRAKATEWSGHKENGVDEALYRSIDHKAKARTGERGLESMAAVFVRERSR
jgi:hypothetical protein